MYQDGGENEFVVGLAPHSTSTPNKDAPFKYALYHMQIMHSNIGLNDTSEPIFLDGLLDEWPFGSNQDNVVYVYLAIIMFYYFLL